MSDDFFAMNHLYIYCTKTNLKMNRETRTKADATTEMMTYKDDEI